MNAAILLAANMTTQRSIGYIVLAIVIVGAVGFVAFQVMTGRKGVGSEIELAANRKPYYDDEELETTRLDGALMAAVGLFILIAVILPLYWLAEPGRQAGAVKHQKERFVVAGEEIYTTKAQCNACHGPAGVGGVASQVINDEDGNFVAQVSWNAPALNTVLWRFSEDEVRYILNYGRPGSPMQPWGTVGGGPYNAQQIDQIIAYLWSVQLSAKDMRAQLDTSIKDIDEGLYDRMMAVRKQNEAKAAELTKEAGQEKTTLDIPPKEMARLDTQDELFLGELLFSLQSSSGAFNCARCHIPGAAYGRAGREFNDPNAGDSKDRTDNGGYTAMAPSLTDIANVSTELQHFDLVMKGTQDGKVYFSRRIGSGKMPGFGINPSAGVANTPQLGPGGMYSVEQVWAVVSYERSQSDKATSEATVPTTDQITSTAAAEAAPADGEG